MFYILVKYWQGGFMRIEEKRATLAIHTLLEKYVDWTATESRCGNCENYDRIWSCPTYDFSVEAF